MMNRILTGLICMLSLAAVHADIFGPLKMGMSHSEAQQALSTFDKVTAPRQTTIMGSESEDSSAFTTTEPYAGAICKLYLNFNDKGLCAVTLQSTETFSADDFDGRFRSRYKQLAMHQQQIYGKPVSTAMWPKASAVKPLQIHMMHYFQTKPELVLCTGIMQTENHEWIVVTRYLSLTGTTLKVPGENKSADQYWAKVPEFYDLVEADKLILQAMDAVAAKKAKEALGYFEEAAQLGSSRGYWGMSFLYSGAIRGVSGDRPKRDEYRNQAATLGFAMSLVEVDKNFAGAMNKLQIPANQMKSTLAKVKRAADEGRMSEQYNLGIMYKNGYGVPKDAAKAKKYLQAAADQGDKQAASALESMKAPAK